MNLSRIVSIVRESFRELGKNDPLRLAGATAFFSTFALPAVVLIMLQIAGLFLSPQEGNARLIKNLNRFVGDQTGAHIKTVLDGFDEIATSPFATIAGVAFILFVATTLFKVIKNSLNQIWKVQVVEKISVGLTLKMRFRGLAIIAAAGVLFLVVVLLEGLQTLATAELTGQSPFLRLILSNSMNILISLAVTTLWFGLIFAFLPDGRYPVRICFIGAFTTSVLFIVGKLVLKELLLHSNVGLIFGKSAAVVLLLLFVFYSSLIFYFGAAFTKALAKYRGAEIRALPHAKARG